MNDCPRCHSGGPCPECPPPKPDPVWNKGTPMPVDYTCHCGMYVHPTKRKPGQIHIEDCPYREA